VEQRFGLAQGKAIKFHQPSAFEATGFHLHMFREDVQRTGQILRGRDNNSRLSLTGPDEERQRVLHLCASLARDYFRSDEDLIGRTLEDVMMHLAYYGDAHYEVVREPNSRNLSLISFPSDGLWHFPGGILQSVPPGGESTDSRTWTFLWSKHVWRVTIPAALGGVRNYRKILKQMSRLESTPPFVQEDLTHQRLSAEFDQRRHAYWLQTRIHQLTNVWGWGGRDWSSTYATEYYLFHRQLTFKWSQAVLRQHVMESFNTLLKRIGIAASASTVGFLSPNEILAIRAKMHAGEIDFAAAMKEVSE
jgi:hypothetical protein